MSHPAPTGARAPDQLRAGRTALLWRLGWLLVPVVAAVVPPPGREILLLGWGGAALAALLYRLTAVPIRAATLWVPPAPALRPLLLLGLALYGVLAGAALLTDSLDWAGLLVAPLVALSLAALLPTRDPALAARAWALAVGGALWALTAVVALEGLSTWPVAGVDVPPPVSLALALAGWSAAHRALLVQGLRPTVAEGLGLVVGLTAIALTGSGPSLLPLGAGFVAGVLIALGATRLLPTPDPAAPAAAPTGELVFVYQQMVFVAPLAWLALFVASIYQG